MPAETLVLVFVAWTLGFFVLAQLALIFFALLRNDRGGAPGEGGWGRRLAGWPLSFAASPGRLAGERGGCAPGTPGAPAPGPVSASSAANALEAWESEGGSVREPPPEAGGRAGDALAPSLPEGHTARLSWGFADQAGRFSYGFFRVYGPTRKLVPGLSYWALRSRAGPADANARWSGWWLNYAQACTLSSPGVTFERFSSPAGMPDEPPANKKSRGPGGARP
jgi:hypothetical protein